MSPLSSTVDIAGRKVPVVVVAAAAAGLFLVLRGRSTGTVVSAGNPPAAISAASPYAGTTSQVLAGDMSALGSNLQNQINALVTQLNANASPSTGNVQPGTVPSPHPPGAGYHNYAGVPDILNGGAWQAPQHTFANMARR